MRDDAPFRRSLGTTSQERRRLARRNRKKFRAALPRSSRLPERESGPIRGEDRWKYADRKVYVDDAVRRKTPVWLVPAAATLLLAVLVFFIAPSVAASLQALFGKSSDENARPATRILSRTTRVVRTTAVDVLDQPDLRATRLTQSLFNTPLETLPERSAFGFTAVRLPDGTEGYVASGALTDECDSAEPYLHAYKLVVSDRVRRIMSHASQGTLLQEVMMGTVLYSDYRGDGVYRVTLPDGGTGWIGQNGLIELAVDAQVRASDADAFVSSAMEFLNMTYLPGGRTENGIDSIGLIRIAAAVNGKELPHAVEGLVIVGTAVPLKKDEETDLWNLEGMRSGDLVLFGPVEGTGAGTATSDVALYVGEGQVLMARPNRSSIRLMTLSDEPALLVRIVAIRRLFTT